MNSYGLGRDIGEMRRELRTVAAKLDLVLDAVGDPAKRAELVRRMNDDSAALEQTIDAVKGPDTPAT